MKLTVGPSFESLIGTGDTLVDLGCADGAILRGASEAFRHRYGIDIALRGTCGAPSLGLHILRADLNKKIPLGDQVADVVVANQVIEHIADVVGFVQEVYRITKPNGRCIITTPNIRYIKNIASLVFSGYGPRTAGGNTLDGDWDDGHVHYFTHKDLRELFENCGFGVVQSFALIDQSKRSTVRRILAAGRMTWPVREFLSGTICLYAHK